MRIEELQSIKNLNDKDSKEGVTVNKFGNILLPKVEIKTFDGNPLNWHSFYGTFSSLVHETYELPSVQKFHLLKNPLAAEASSAIASLNATGENYIAAWELLKRRYDQPRQIIHAHINSLLQSSEVSYDSPSKLRNLIEQVQVHINALNALKQPTNYKDAFLIYIITNKLDKVTRRAWERTLEPNELPTLTQLMEFLNKQARGEDYGKIQGVFNPVYNSRKGDSKKPENNSRNHSYVGVQGRKYCPICKQNHEIYVCVQFLNLNPRDRFQAAQKARICINCLNHNHVTSKCYKNGCKKCNKKHNTLLHFQEEDNEVSPRNSESTESVNVEIPGTTLTVLNKSEVLLGTATMVILDHQQGEHKCRVLLDSCSQSHFITEKLANKLQLRRMKIDLSFSGLGQLATKSQYYVKATIRSEKTGFITEETFVTLPTITGTLPSHQINRNALHIPKNICLADSEFHKPSEIDMLLGSNLFYKLLCVGQIRLKNSDVMLQKTRLGWIVTGNAQIHRNNVAQQPKTNMCLVTSTIETSTDQLMRKFWEIEEVSSKMPLVGQEDQCEKHFKETHTRKIDGRYIVRLPFKENKSQIGSSYDMALQRFHRLEKRLVNNNDLYAEYTEFLKEYINLGHMSDISDTDDITEGYYLPHHAVRNNASLTTKLRVVFDGSAKSSTNISLNDILRVGPTIQNDLISILLRFRVHPIAITADIEKMYRQIEVHPQDALYQKILWRENQNEPIKVYKLNTVTYGTACAPFLAIRTLQQLAQDEADKQPLVQEILREDLYVDDLLTGAETVENAAALKHDLIKLASRGGFNLRKWSSNCSELTDNYEDNNIELSHDKSMKLLGIQWNPIKDTITYAISNPKNSKRFTKRSILSQIAQLYDPLGLLGPILTRAKLILQQLWQERIDWDESIPQSICTAWCELQTGLSLLKNISIPRRESKNIIR